MHNIQLRRTFIITQFFRFVNPVEKNNGGDDKLLFNVATAARCHPEQGRWPRRRISFCLSKP